MFALAVTFDSKLFAVYDGSDFYGGLGLTAVCRRGVRPRGNSNRDLDAGIVERRALGILNG
jgi:hypothetical protein